jgi:hypothetical protein
MVIATMTKGRVEIAIAVGRPAAPLYRPRSGERGKQVGQKRKRLGSLGLPEPPVTIPRPSPSLPDEQSCLATKLKIASTQRAQWVGARNC